MIPPRTINPTTISPAYYSIYYYFVVVMVVIDKVFCSLCNDAIFLVVVFIIIISLVLIFLSFWHRHLRYIFYLMTFYVPAYLLLVQNYSSSSTLPYLLLPLRFEVCCHICCCCPLQPLVVARQCRH
jgi:hypothetical protein